MCGFVGSIHNDNSEQRERLTDIKQMNQLIYHRGPDDEGYFDNQDITVGFRRLSIIDLQHGKQPLADQQQRYWVVFNGEIYNYIELRDELKQLGYQFATDSDTEVLLAAYQHYGIQLLDHLRGMFAFVIWDTQTHEIFGARDQFGIKPFYFEQQDDSIYFASEKKVFAQINDFQDISEEALQNYMTFQYVPGAQTLNQSVNELLPGHYFIKRPHQDIQVKKYFDAQFKPHKVTSTTALMTELQQTLTASVACHMRSDVPVGAFLSGGIDSSIIVALASQLHPHLKTFSVGFEHPGYSEIDLAKETATMLGVENISRVITPTDFMAEFTKFVYYMDDPLADPAAFAQYFLARLAHEHCKVALTGEGADELFGGYCIYHEPKSLQCFNWIPQPLKTMLHASVAQLPPTMKGRNFLLRGTTPLEHRFIGNAKIFNEQEKAQLLKQYDQHFPFYQAVSSVYQRNHQLDAITRMQDVDMHTWLPGDLLLNADRTSMASGLELRTPFIDRQVFSVAQKIPTNLRVAHGTTKYILRETAKAFLPTGIVDRQKLGFPIPIRVWLKNELHDWAVDMIQTANVDQWLDKAYCLQLLDEHCQGHRDNSRKIWTILTFITWHRVFVERTAS